ncbi:MAG: hypothetical protein ABIR31_00945 [Ginsengibacter sp.]
MHRVFSFLIAILFSQILFAQSTIQPDRKFLEKKEDSLKSIALQIIQGRNAEDRFKADSLFTKMFVRALKTKGSFNYPFDSLITISKLTSPDKLFKIFTWQLVVNDNVVRQHGAIQMNTSDGSLQLFPLIDKTGAIINVSDTIANNFGWVGAVYYKIIQKKAFGRDYYTLLGYDENNLSSDRKIIEVLTFNDGKPIFGGGYFSFPDNSVNKRGFARYIMEYKKNASPRLTYDPDLDMIIYEHMISETGEPNKKYTYVGDGDYEGLKWTDGKWVHIQKIFTQKTEEGKEPVPLPIRDAEGNIDYSKLSQRQPENNDKQEVDKTKPAPTTKKKKDDD